MSHLAPFSTPLPDRIGDFVVVGVLGEGGSGIVYDARWGHREVALKVLHPSLVATQKEREQFLVEARLLADMRHPAVVKVLAVGEAPDGRPYLAMEKLAGEALATRLTRGPLPVAQALELFGQLADAVAALHAQGLVHRDLKPENVVLVAGAGGAEHAVLLDFGIAKELAAGASTTTQEGKVRGTPAYMAPERFFGQPASVATDVYELAVTLFAMLAGRLPWDDSADPEVRLDPRRLADLAPHVPAALDVEVRRALSTRAQNRPAGAVELRAAVMTAAGTQWAPRATVDVRRPRSDSQPVRFGGDEGSGPIALNVLGGASGAAMHGSTTATPRRRRVVMWAVLGSVAVIGIGVAAHLLSKPGAKIDGGGASTVAAADPKPVAVPAPATGPATETGTGTGTGSGTGSAGAVDGLRAPAKALIAPPSVAATQLGAVLAHLPDDETYAVGAQVGAINADKDLAGLLDLLGGSTSLRLIRAQAGLGDCDLDVRGKLDWLVMAGPEDEGTLDLIVSGRWTRSELEGCLTKAAGGGELTSGDRVSILRGKKGERVIGWLDDHTAFLSSRGDADEAWMMARLDDTTPATGELATYYGETDLGGLIWIVGEAAGQRLGLSQDAEAQAMWGAMTADAGNAMVDVRVRYPSDKAAAAAAADLQTQADELGLGGLGKVEIDRDPARPTIVHGRVELARLIVGGIVAALVDGTATP